MTLDMITVLSGLYYFVVKQFKEFRVTSACINCHQIPVDGVVIYIFIPQYTRLTKGKSKDGLAYCNKKGLWCLPSRCRLTVKRSVNAIMIYWHQLTLRQADRAMWYKPLPCKSYKSYYHANVAILQWIVSSGDDIVLSRRPREVVSTLEPQRHHVWIMTWNDNMVSIRGPSCCCISRVMNVVDKPHHNQPFNIKFRFTAFLKEYYVSSGE